MATEPFKRYRFSVPDADVSINQWVEKQSNLSMSLRMLIGECIERNGFGDYTCRIRTPGAKRGRPPKLMDAGMDDSDLGSVVSQPFMPSDMNAGPIPAESVRRPAQQPAAVGKTSAQTGVLSDDEIAKMFG